MKNLVSTAHLMLFCLLLGVTASCQQTQENNKNSHTSIWGGAGIKGEGPTVEKTLNVGDFEGIAMSVGGDTYLTQGGTASVKVKGQQNVIDNLKTEVRNGVLHVKFDKSVRNYDKLEFEITVPTLKEVSVAGSGNVVSRSDFKNLNDVRVAISGSGDIQLSLSAQNVKSSIAGSGNMQLKGSTNSLDISIAGSGDLNADGLQAQTATVSISGSGNSEVNVQQDLDVRVAGSGDVYYRGRPSVRSKVSGSGNVQSRS